MRGTNDVDKENILQCESINKEELPIFKSEQKVTQVDQLGASVGLGWEEGKYC